MIKILIRKLVLVITLSLSSFVTSAQNASPNISVNVKGPTFFSATAKVNISNDNPFPYIVLVKIFNNGVGGNLVSEIATTVNAGESVSIEAEPNPNTKFGSPLSWLHYSTIGSLNYQQKDNNFQIPFESSFKVKICQSSDGPQTTHKGDRVNAIDFCAPEKTLIVAAKDGTVIEIIQNFTKGGKDLNLLDKANTVRILHDDGLTSEYAHIYPNSAKVGVGDRVVKGQPIALVGNVGYSSGAHLHFEVAEGLSKLNDQNRLRNAIPIHFINRNNEEIKIKYGDSYTVDGQIDGTSKQSGSQTTQPVPNNQPYSNTSKNSCDNSNVDAIKRANDCYLQNQFDKTVEILKIYISKNTSNPRAYGMLALALSRSQKYAESIPYFQKRISFGGFGYDICAFYARSLDATGNINESIIWNKKALEFVPNLIDVRKTLAEQLVKTGKKQEAINLLQSFDDGREQKGQNRIFSAQIDAIKNGN